MADLKELIAVVEAIPADARDRAMPGDSWSPRDVVAHIAAWQEAAIERIAASGRSPVNGAAEIDAWNAAAHERWAGVPWSEVLVRLRESRERLTAIAGSPAPAWVRDWTDDHYDDHLVDLRAAASRSKN